MHSTSLTTAELNFNLEIEDGWPPVSTECLPCFVVSSGFKIKAPPLFIKDISVDDIIVITEKESGQVWSWKHIEKSNHSTAWVMTFGNFNIDEQLSKLRSEGCNITSFPSHHIFTIDVPPNVSASFFDECFIGISPEEVAIAYPSWRHEV